MSVLTRNIALPRRPIRDPSPEGVQPLTARNIPRDYIRKRILQRLWKDRDRFPGLVDTIPDEAGSAQRLEKPWQFKRHVIMEWLAPHVAVRRLTTGTVDAFETIAP